VVFDLPAAAPSGWLSTVCCVMARHRQSGASDFAPPVEKARTLGLLRRFNRNYGVMLVENPGAASASPGQFAGARGRYGQVLHLLEILPPGPVRFLRQDATDDVTGLGWHDGDVVRVRRWVGHHQQVSAAHWGSITIRDRRGHTVDKKPLSRRGRNPIRAS
jgi:hypothetical protein